MAMGLVCPECGSEDLDLDTTGDGLVCLECGYDGRYGWDYSEDAAIEDEDESGERGKDEDDRENVDDDGDDEELEEGHSLADMLKRRDEERDKFMSGSSSVICPTCDKAFDPRSEFRDELSAKEFTISGMCQDCQDDVFGK